MGRAPLTTLLALLLVAGCGQAPRMASLAPLGEAGARMADLPLHELPAEELHVPAVRVRAPHAETRDNGAVLHVGPAENVAALKALIKGAKQSVYLETFNFGHDAMGQQLVPLLVEKARAGLEVKVLMDFVGSRYLKGHKDMVRLLRRAGVDVVVYRPRTIVKDDKRVGVNITHRKVYLADGQVGLVGGVNIAKGFESTTQDLLIEWTGPVVGQLYAEFTHDWLLAGGRTLKQVPVPAPAAGRVAAQLVVTSPGEGRFEARDAIYRAIEGAKREIRIENQFLWDDPMVERLLAARARGVAVRVIVPGGHMGKLLINVHGEDLHRLQLAGAAVKLYQGVDPDAHLHAKYFGIDDAWTATGSVNADTRALLDNQELDVITTDRRLASEVQARLFEHDWQKRSRAYEHKPGGWLLRPVRSLIELIDYYL